MAIYNWCFIKVDSFPQIGKMNKERSMIYTVRESCVEPWTCAGASIKQTLSFKCIHVSFRVIT